MLPWGWKKDNDPRMKKGRRFSRIHPPGEIRIHSGSDIPVDKTMPHCGIK